MINGFDFIRKIEGSVLFERVCKIRSVQDKLTCGIGDIIPESPHMKIIVIGTSLRVWAVVGSFDVGPLMVQWSFGGRPLVGGSDELFRIY